MEAEIGVKCNGLKQPVSGKKYFDFVLPYIDVNRKTLQATFQSIVLYVMSYSEAESADVFCSELD